MLMEKRNGRVTLSFVNKPLEFISYQFGDAEALKNDNDESIKKTFRIMKNRKFSDVHSQKGGSEQPKEGKAGQAEEEEAGGRPTDWQRRSSRSSKRTCSRTSRRSTTFSKSAERRSSERTSARSPCATI